VGEDDGGCVGVGVGHVLDPFVDGGAGPHDVGVFGDGEEEDVVSHESVGVGIQLRSVHEGFHYGVGVIGVLGIVFIVYSRRNHRTIDM